MSVFDYANVHLRQKGLPDGYAVRVVAAQAAMVPSDTLMGLQATHAGAGGSRWHGLHRAAGGLAPYRAGAGCIGRAGGLGDARGTRRWGA